MRLDVVSIVSTLISLGILGVASYGVRLLVALRDDVSRLKAAIGINSIMPDVVLLPEVVRLRQANHDLRDTLNAMRLDLAILKAESDRRMSKRASSPGRRAEDR